MPEDEDIEEGGARPFWSGTIVFGLVSLPVSLYVGHRSRSVSLRMLDQDGTPLARRLFCSRDDKPLARDDLVRGYEIEPDKFIEVEDDELDNLEPEKSREIDLRRFVPLEQIDPMYFDRAYFLVPDKEAPKAYRLLAQSLENMGRAGIATFVMRGKEYLVAIIAEGGVLRAETLRFEDELRSPADIGLPELEKAPAATKRKLLNAMKAMHSKKLDRDDLSDRSSRELLALVERKLETDEDVLHAPDLPEEEQQGAVVIDLMEVLRQRLADKQEPEKKAGERKADPKKTSPKKSSSKKIDPDASKTELYERAQALDIAGRSKMSRQQLLRAIEKAS